MAQVQIGSPVEGTNGKLGEVHRVIVDARTNNVTDIVVKHGFVFGKERMVPLGYVERVDDAGVVHVKLDEKGFEAMEPYVDDRFHAPDPDYVGPPGFDRGLWLVDTLWLEAAGTGGTASGKPLGFPGGEQISPNDIERPAVAPGTPILDVDGEKIGEVHELAWEADGGKPTRLVMRRGTLFHTDTELPLAWVQNLSDEGVYLNVDRARVESLQHQASRT